MSLFSVIAGSGAVVAAISGAVFCARRRMDNRVLARMGELNQDLGTSFPSSRKGNFQHCVHHRSLGAGALFFDLTTGKMALVRSLQDIQVLPITDILRWEPMRYGENGAEHVLRVTVHDLSRPIFDLRLGSQAHLMSWTSRVGMFVRKAASQKQFADDISCVTFNGEVGRVVRRSMPAA